MECIVENICVKNEEYLYNIKSLTSADYPRYKNITSNLISLDIL